MTRDLDAPYVFVDPGKHASGVAWFADRVLERVEYRLACAPLDPLETPLRPWCCVCEKPRVRSEAEQRRDGRRIRSSDIEDLLIAAGRMTGQLPTEYVSVAAWKGTAKKGPMHARLPRILSRAELTIVESLDCAPARRHNVYDAICLGLKWLGRWR